MVLWCLFIAMGLTLAVVCVGVGLMAIQSSWYEKYSHHLMVARVALQAVSIFLVMLYLMQGA